MHNLSTMLQCSVICESKAEVLSLALLRQQSWATIIDILSVSLGHENA
jgi:hypothetical protein